MSLMVKELLMLWEAVYMPGWSRQKKVIQVMLEMARVPSVGDVVAISIVV